MRCVDRHRPRRQRDRGAAAVEAALVLPIILLLVFGIIDFGRMINAQIKVTEAAREGARALALDDPLASGDLVNNRVSTIMGNPTSVPSGDKTTCLEGSAAEVTVRHSFTFVTPITALAGLVTGPIELNATGVMACHG